MNYDYNNYESQIPWMIDDKLIDNAVFLTIEMVSSRPILLLVYDNKYLKNEPPKQSALPNSQQSLQMVVVKILRQTSFSYGRNFYLCSNSCTKPCVDSTTRQCLGKGKPRIFNVLCMTFT